MSPTPNVKDSRKETLDALPSLTVSREMSGRRPEIEASYSLKGILYFRAEIKTYLLKISQEHWSSLPVFLSVLWLD